MVLETGRGGRQSKVGDSNGQKAPKAGGFKARRVGDWCVVGGTVVEGEFCVSSHDGEDKKGTKARWVEMGVTSKSICSGRVWCRVSKCGPRW